LRGAGPGPAPPGGRAALVHGLQMRNAAEKVSM
jgi:hypothetical protein